MKKIETTQEIWIIYKHTNITSGKYYIGQTKFTIEKRWAKHTSEAFNKERNSYMSYFSKAIRKYGKDNWRHEIIEQNIETLDIANERETFWIAAFKANQKKFGYNSTSGGGQFKHNQETKDKIGKANTGKHTRLGQKHPFEERVSRSKTRTNKKISDEQVFEILKIINENNLTYKEIGKMFNVTRTGISQLKQDRICVKIKEKEGLKFNITRTKHNIKISNEQIPEIFKLKEQNITYKAIGNMYGVSDATISNIINGIRKYIKTE